MEKDSFFKKMDIKLESLTEYQLSENPEDFSFNEWKYPKMYKKDIKGNKRVWFGAVTSQGIVTSYGLVDGIKQITEPYAIELNNSGRNYIEQASLELRSRYEVKMRKEGFRFPGEIKSINTKPMLAEDWWKRKSNTVLYYPVVIQPKLDGIRCLVKKDNDSCNIIYRSRTNKTYDFGYLFDEEINAILMFFPFQVELDGELYIHGMMLQGISSVVSLKISEDEIPTLKGTKKEHAIDILKIREDKLKYNIFTIITPNDMVYEDRNELLVKAYNAAEKYLGRHMERVVIVHDEPVFSIEDIEKNAKKYTEKLGYEGLMIYKLGLSLPPNKISESYYKSSRSWNLIKYKPFFDEEMIILLVKGGKGKASELAGFRVEDNKGITHEVNIAESDDIRKYIFDNPLSVIGKEATVKHYGRTEDGKLRHASVIAIRDYE